MKITILQSNLNKALGIISRAVSTKSNLEILGCILLKTEGGRLKLSSTNLEIGISSYIGGRVDKNGEVAVPARLFVDYISTLPNKKIEIETENGIIKLKSDGYKSSIKILPSEEFPLIPQTKKEEGFKISKEELKKAIGLTFFAAAADESRPVLSGIYLNIKDETLILAATDSYRLAEKKTKIKGKGNRVQVILPARALAELSRILEGEGDVEIFIDENQALFKTEDLEFTTRLIEGDFPDYKKIIPESSETKVKLKKDEFLSAIKAVSLFSRESTNSVNLNVNKKGEVEVSSPQSQSGDSTAVIAAEVEGGGGEITFNSKYLSDVLLNTGSANVVFEMSDHISACAIHTEEDSGYVYIVMPLRT